MFEIAAFEIRRRLRGSIVLGILLSALGAMMVGFFPSFATSGVDFERYIESLPPLFREAFGVEAISTIDGFLATELYQFGWVLLLGLYFAYRGGSLIAGAIERGRMDILLSTPVSRGRVVTESALALVGPAVVVNVIVAPVVLVGTVLIGEPVDVVDLLAVHLLSIPYLLACGTVGLVLSTGVHDADTAQRSGLGLIFALFLVDSVSASTDYDWLGSVSPTRYYDPTAILVRSEYDLAGAMILLVASAVLVVIARAVFASVDIE